MEREKNDREMAVQTSRTVKKKREDVLPASK